jgi:hypothetical protein
MATRAREQSLRGRELGSLPPIADPGRRLRCIRRLPDFCQTYFPETFTLPFSDDHLSALATIQHAVWSGGLFALALPRAHGKSSMLKAAIIYVILSGAQQYLYVIGAQEEAARAALADVKTELSTNPLLLADFPEAVYPIAAMENVSQRATGQLLRGRPTRLVWKTDRIVMPTVPGSPSSGTVVDVSGLLGAVRGAKFTTPDGRVLRPGFFLADDIQTDDSARSPVECQKREAILSGALLNLAGPDRPIAGILLGTVICPGDVMANLLDHQKHPRWRGQRTPLVKRMPKNLDLWREYGELLDRELESGRDPAAATDFYRDRREFMDLGAAVSWEHRKLPHHLSALQYAMDHFLRDPDTFYAEMQNDPRDPGEGEDRLTPDLLASKCLGLPRGTVPDFAHRLVAAVDVQKRLLYWTVCAFADDFTGHLVDYGTWPQQVNRYFTRRNAKRTLARRYPATSLEQQLFKGLEDLFAELLAPGRWRRQDGTALPITRALIDANWKESTEIVMQFCAAGPGGGGIVLPAFGRFVGAKSLSGIPNPNRKKRRGERPGFNWLITVPMTGIRFPYCAFDSNFWKSFFSGRVRVPMAIREGIPIAAPGGLTFPGRNGRAEHKLLFDHLCAERPVRVEAHGRAVDEWQPTPDEPDNDFLDTLGMAFVAASIEGSRLPGLEPRPKPRVRLSDVQRRKR